jgi:hypothetical protein
MEINNGQRYDFLDRLATKNFTSYESRVLLTIIKCHLIYKNGGVIISRSRICRATELQDGHVTRSLRGLIQKKILFKSQKDGLPFYSFTPPIEAHPIREGVTPIQEGTPPPIEVENKPIREGVIRTSNKDNINISGDKENQKAEKHFESFFDGYPGAWNKGVEAQAKKKFLILSEPEQAQVLAALAHYKKSKSVQDKKILSPINFLNSSKIIKQYAEQSTPKKSENSTGQNIEKWKKEQQADPPQGSLKEHFEKLVNSTATEKGVAKKGRVKHDEVYR